MTAESLTLEEALREADQKELAWRQTFNAVADDVLATRRAKVNLRALKKAEAEYTAACVRLHQTMKAGR